MDDAMQGTTSDGELVVSVAGIDDVDAVVELVTSAYRGEASRAGWTTEADLLEGQRVDADMVAEVIDEPDAAILLVHADDELVACCELRLEGDRAQLSMFAVRPSRQGEGRGRAVLAAAEAEAVRRWSAGAVELSVISLRAELIAWYERRGYVRTDRRAPFPYGDERFGRPTRPDLGFEILEKHLPAR